MTKSQMLEKISDHYAKQFGVDGIYAYAGALSVFVTEQDLQKLINWEGIEK